MSNLTERVLIYVPGRRRPRAARPIIVSETMSVIGGAMPFTEPISPVIAYGANNDIYNFAFASVVGASVGSGIYTNLGNLPINIGASENVTINKFYVPTGGGTPGVGVWVDAFNVDTGEFSDSDFIDVLTNNLPDLAKTNTANIEGYVLSDTAEDLRAKLPVDSLPFSQWQKIGERTEASIDYLLDIKESGIVFAFFKTKPAGKLPSGDFLIRWWTKIIGGVTWDGPGWRIKDGGKPEPIDSYQNLIVKLLITPQILNQAATKAEKATAIKQAMAHLDQVKNFIATNGF